MIAQLIVYGFIAATVLGGLGLLHHKIFEEGAASTCTRVTAADDCLEQPELTRLVQERDEARSASKAREGELADLRKASDRQNAGAAAVAKIGQSIKADNALFLAELAKRNQDSMAQITEWQKRATGTDPEKENCNAQLKDAGDILRDVLQRVRQ
jgi:hypothetical protein